MEQTRSTIKARLFYLSEEGYRLLAKRLRISNITVDNLSKEQVKIKSHDTKRIKTYLIEGISVLVSLQIILQPLWG